MTQPPPDKLCAYCGRSFSWRAKWADEWESVCYCSDRCRRDKRAKLDAAIEAKILEMLAERTEDATICPSEAAKAVRPDDWRDHMERTRCAARRLACSGRVRITQDGKPIDPDKVKGPIRIGRSRG